MGKIKNFLVEMFYTPFDSSSDKKFTEPEEKIIGPELPNIEDPEETQIEYNSAFYTLDFDAKFRNIKEAILKYRDISTNFEIEEAIDEITYSAVVDDGNGIVSLDLDNIEDDIISKNTKEKIRDEFENILKLLSFKNKGSNYFRKWYIDGRLWFQILTGNENKGIAKIRILSPLDITRIKKDGEYKYIYKEDERNKSKRNAYQLTRNPEVEMGLEIPEKNVVFVPSGLVDPLNDYYISHLHKAIKPLNQLRLLEDSMVIYRITRAPERRVFYIDVGKLPKSKAEQYVKNLMNKFKSSIVYDVKTGEVTQRKNVMTMLEDFYLPSRGDSKGTRIETLQGGQQLGEIDDILYAKKRLLKSLKVPVSRFDDENQPVVDFGNSGELTRAELKFSNFIGVLRKDFSSLFIDLLKIQLILKNIINIKEFNSIVEDLNFVWSTNSYFSELKETEILNGRIELANSLEPYIGKYFSNIWVRKNIFKFTDEEIETMQKEIDDEKKTGEINEEEDNISK